MTEFNIRPLTSSSVILDKVSMEAGSLGMMDYEGEYLTQDQRESEGPQVSSVSRRCYAMLLCRDLCPQTWEALKMYHPCHITFLIMKSSAMQTK